MNQKKYGIILSYISTAITALMNIVLVPFLISRLGSAEYGVYKIISSFAGNLLIMDMGIGTIVTRYVSLYKSKDDKEGINRTIATSTVSCIVLMLLVLSIGYILRESIPYIYANSLSDQQLSLASNLFILMIINIVITIITHLFTGYIKAYEKFVITNGFSVIRLVLRITILYLVINITKDAISIILVDISINLFLLFAYAFYSFLQLKMKIIISMFDKKLMIQYIIFAGAILFQTIVNHVNNSVDNMILGAMMAPEIVTMYSSGLTIYGLYVSLPEAVNQVFLPQATRMFGEKLPNDDGTILTNFVIRAGRYEAVLCLGILGAFICIGRDFVQLWVGSNNINAWIVALLLMIPVTIPMCENLMVTILNACNKRMFRSCVLAAVAVFNVTITIILIPDFGYVGAAIGTFLSIFIGHGIILNIYYKKKFKLKIIYMLKKTYITVMPCMIISTLIVYFLSHKLPISWFNFFCKSTIFVMIYGIMLWIFHFNEVEKNTLISIFKKRGKD